jgi:hypothetical protein
MRSRVFVETYATQMTNNVNIGIFYFPCTKNIFSIFPMQTTSFFVKQLSKIILMIEQTQFIKILEHFKCTITIVVEP